MSGTSRNVPSILGFEMIFRVDYKSLDLIVSGLIIFPQYHFKPRDRNIPWCSLLRKSPSVYYRFSPPISVTSSFNFRKCVFNFVPDPLECANARFNFVFGRSILKHCHSISCFVTRFRQLLFQFVGHSSWARDSKGNFVYWHSFSSKFQSKSSPRCQGPITPDEFEWQNNEFVWKNDEFDPCIRITRLATGTNFSDNYWRIWMPNC